MKRAFVIFIITSCVLFEIDWMLCDLFYEDTNSWNILRNKFESAETFLILTALILALKNFMPFLRLAYFKADIEKDIPTRIVIAYWQFSLGDFMDRVFFNVDQWGINDVFIYLYVAYYSYKTFRIYVNRGKIN